MQLFPRFHPIPFTKMITLYRREAFSLQVAYESDTPFPDRHIGEYKINNVTPSVDGENTKVKIKTKLDLNGIFCVRSATAYEKGEEIEVPVQEEPMEVDNTSSNGNGVAADATNNSTTPDDVAMAPGSNSTSDIPAELPPAPEEKKPAVQLIKKQQYKTLNLPVDSHTNWNVSQSQLMNLIEAEAQMVAQDRKEKDRIDVKNALEEYVYNLRDKLDGVYRDFVTEDEKTKMVEILNALENWLYEEGEDQERSVYAQKLEELKKFGDGVKQKLEEEERKLLEEHRRLVEESKEKLEAARAAVAAKAQEEAAQEHEPSAPKDEGIEIPIQLE